MNNLTIINHNGNKVIDSREVAEMTGKRHDHLVRDIQRYAETIDNSENPKLGSLNFFIPHTYAIDGQARTYPCYLLTRKGCDMVANKMTGDKGVLFTAAYVTKFEEMEKFITKPKAQKVSGEEKLRIQEMNAKTRMSNMYLKLANVDTLSSEYKSILVSKAAEVLTGAPLLPPIKSVQRTYSAREIGEMFGATSQMIGRIANGHGLKVPEYGEYYRDKSRYSSKEVDSFRYYDAVIPRFKEILGVVK